jgi:hypothetical protein
MAERLRQELGGDFQVTQAALHQAAEDKSLDRHAAIIVAQNTFSAHQMDELRAVCAVQPRPHVILACPADNRTSLINAVNLRPFRLVDLAAQTAEEDLVQAVQSALANYDTWEVFKVRADCVHRAEREINWVALQEILQEEEQDQPSDTREETEEGDDDQRDDAGAEW